jgi:hypothetical protein
MAAFLRMFIPRPDAGDRKNATSKFSSPPAVPD